MTDWLDDEGFTIFLSTPECFTIRAKFPTNHVHSGLDADFVLARKEHGYIRGNRKHKFINWKYVRNDWNLKGYW